MLPPQAPFEVSGEALNIAPLNIDYLMKLDSPEKKAEFNELCRVISKISHHELRGWVGEPLTYHLETHLKTHHLNDNERLYLFTAELGERARIENDARVKATFREKLTLVLIGWGLGLITLAITLGVSS